MRCLHCKVRCQGHDTREALEDFYDGLALVFGIVGELDMYACMASCIFTQGEYAGQSFPGSGET